jgi:hypothetical protein
MGSPQTLDPAPTRPPATDRHVPSGGVELLAHLQTPAAFGGHEFGDWPVDQIANGFGGDPHARHRHDHTRLANEFPHTHPDLERDAVRDAEQAFDRLNPTFGVPADQRSHFGRQAVRDREAALILGIRVAVHDSRQNDRNRSSGSPARTTGPPTPSTPPATNPPAPGTAPSGSAPNANADFHAANRTLTTCRRSALFLACIPSLATDRTPGDRPAHGTVADLSGSPRQ